MYYESTEDRMQDLLIANTEAEASLMVQAASLVTGAEAVVLFSGSDTGTISAAQKAIAQRDQERSNWSRKVRHQDERASPADRQLLEQEIVRNQAGVSRTLVNGGAVVLLTLKQPREKGIFTQPLSRVPFDHALSEVKQLL